MDRQAIKPLRKLEACSTSRGSLRVVEVRPGRFAEERDVLVAVGRDPRASIRVKSFAGRSSEAAPPWIEAAFARDNERFAAEIVAALVSSLPPEGRLMVIYGDDETERGLMRGIPPAATPLGHALVAAGCTWLKDWYFAEGGLEGEAKLQGNKPPDDQARRLGVARLHRGLRAWLRSAQEDDAEIARARRRALAILEGGSAGPGR